MRKQFCSLVFYVLLRHTSIITDKGFNVIDGCTTRCVHLFPQEEECTSSSWGDSKMYKSDSITNSQRMLTEVNESGAVAKIRVLVKSDPSNIKGIKNNL